MTNELKKLRQSDDSMLQSFPLCAKIEETGLHVKICATSQLQIYSKLIMQLMATFRKSVP